MRTSHLLRKHRTWTCSPKLKHGAYRGAFSPFRKLGRPGKWCHDLPKDGSVDIFGNPARRKTTGGWKSASFVLGEYLASEGSELGCVYLMKSLHLSNGAAANAATNWVGTSYATSLIGAFLGDAYLGRYWASVLFVAIHFLVEQGTLLLTVQAAIPSLRSHTCKASEEICQPPSTGQKAFLYTALYISALGAERTKKSAYFSYFFVSSLLGSLFVTVVLSYIEVHRSYAIGFGVSTVTIAMAGLLFIAGSRYYRHFKPGGNPFSRAMQVIVAGTRKWRTPVPIDSSLLYEQATVSSRRILHSTRLRFLDKAATITDGDRNLALDKIGPWRLCTVTQVEEVKCIVLMTPIWVSACLYQLVAAQVSTTFVEQGASMDTRLGNLNVSPASLYTFYTIAVVVAAGLYERFLVPAARRLSKKESGITVLQRMGIGNVIMTLAMAVAAVVEIKRLQVVHEHHLVDNPVTTVPMTVFWQVPQYVLTGVAEVFTYVAQTEFFYDQAPDGVRGLGSALSMANVAVGNYLSTLTVTILNNVTRQRHKQGWLPEQMNQGRLDLFFWVMTAISALNLLYYLVCAHTSRAPTWNTNRGRGVLT